MKVLALAALTLAPLAVIQAAPKPTNFAPLDYFEENCARCHGPNGSFYGTEFGKGLKDDDALRHIVKEMAEGPGNAPLSPENLEILTDFHRSLRDGKPYIVVVEARKSEKCLILSGEATPDSQITLENGKEVVAVKLEGHKWSVAVPPNFDIEKASLRAVKEGKEKRVPVS